ncbi:hypothetical protein OH77DRAFT_1432148 [Trametes cingulata]|nr:hypothetical protein OH77DRAFT_1432148 [Trametes cingulata]
MGPPAMSPLARQEAAIRRFLLSRPFRLYVLASCIATFFRVIWSKYAVPPYTNVPASVDMALGSLVGGTCGLLAFAVVLRILVAILPRSDASQEGGDVDSKASV